MGYWSIIFISALLTGFIGQYVAKEKNREQGEGFILGFLLSVLGIIVVALLPTKSKNRQLRTTQEPSEEEKEAIIEKQKKLEEARIRGQKIVARNNRILFGILIVSVFIAIIMMIWSRSRDTEKNEVVESRYISIN